MSGKHGFISVCFTYLDASWRRFLQGHGEHALRRGGHAQGILVKEEPTEGSILWAYPGGVCVTGICLVDTDSDGVFDVDDDCPTIPNTTQTNTDLHLPGGDLLGDGCDPDDDGAGVLDAAGPREEPEAGGRLEALHQNLGAPCAPELGGTAALLYVEEERGRLIGPDPGGGSGCAMMEMIGACRYMLAPGAASHARRDALRAPVGTAAARAGTATARAGTAAARAGTAAARAGTAPARVGAAPARVRRCPGSGGRFERAGGGRWRSAWWRSAERERERPRAPFAGLQPVKLKGSDGGGPRA